MARNIRDTTVVLQEGLQLSDVQVAEIKKAFSLFDRDADGFIDAADLKPESPSDADIKKILELLDEDQSGVIDIQDFLVCMSKWLSDAARSSAGTKQVLRPEEERQQVHDNIKAFFSQFKKEAGLDRVRQLQQSARERPNFYELMDLDNMAFSGLRKSEIPPQQKLEALGFTRQAVLQWARIVQGLRSEVPSEVLIYAKNMTRVLSIVEVCDSALERQAFGSMIFKVFELIVQTGVVNLLAKRLPSLLEPQIQFEALKALTYLIPGPRVFSVPKTHLFHPSQMLFKVLVANEGALQTFLALLASPVPEIKEQVVLAVGAFASNDPEPRDMILQSNLVPAILQQVSPIASISMLRKISWTLSVCCGVTHSIQRLPAWDAIVGSLRALAFLALSDDEEILSNVCAAFSLVLPGVPQQDLLTRLCQLFNHPVFRVRRAALGTIMEIIRYDAQQTNMLMELGLVRSLSELLKTPDNKLRIDVCELLIVLSLKGFVDDIMRTEAPGVLMTLLGTDDDLRWKIVKVLKYLTRSAAPSIRRLGSFGIVSVLCTQLSSFKTYDRVLSSVYGMNQPTFDVEFVRDVVSTLQNLITAGEADASHNAMNPYAALFDLNSIDQIYTLLKAMHEMQPKEKDGSAPTQPSWRASSRGGESSIEEKIMDVLAKVKKAADIAPNQHVSSMIVEIWTRFFLPHGYSLGHAQTRQVTLKIYYQNEARVLEVAPSLSFADLDAQLAKKFGRRMSISYKDEEDETVLIDSDTAMSRAMAHFMTSTASKVGVGAKAESVGKLYLTDYPSSPSNSPVLSAQLSSSPVTSRLVQTQQAAPGSPKMPARQVAFSTINSVIPIPTKPEEFSLNKSDLEEVIRAEKMAIIRLIAKQTSVTKEKLAMMYAEWNRNATPQGLAREFVTVGMKSIGVSDIVIEQAWTTWTEMVKEKIDYRDFGCALATIIKGTIDDITAFIFWQYSEGKGHLTQGDVENIFKIIYALGDRAISGEELRLRIAEMFPASLNRLSEEEWKGRIATQNMFLTCLLAGR